MSTAYDDYQPDYDRYEQDVVDVAFERHAEDAYEDDLGDEDPDIEALDDEEDLRRVEGLMPWAGRNPEGLEPGYLPSRYDDDEIPF